LPPQEQAQQQPAQEQPSQALDSAQHQESQPLAEEPRHRHELQQVQVPLRPDSAPQRG
jgi:hypothetical protein